METIITTTMAFIATDLDDLFLMMFFFAETNKTCQLILGKYIGLAALIGISMLGALGVTLIAQQYLFLLGLLPIFLGIKEIWQRVKNKEEDTPVSDRSPMWNMALITLAGGGDNVAVYISLFAGFSTVQTLIALIVFAIMNLLLCWAARTLAHLPALRQTIEKYKTVLIPTILFALGIYILFF